MDGKSEKRFSEEDEIVKKISNQQYAYGFSTDVSSYDTIQKGLNEDVVRLISSRKNEPEWLLDFRLEAFRYWKRMTPPSDRKSVV